MNEAMMEAFKRRAGSSNATRLEGTDAQMGAVLGQETSQPSPDVQGAAPPGAQAAKPENETANILQQAGGKVTQPELIEVLISRLKNMLPKQSTK